MIRDKRWENVHGYVGFPQGYIYEGNDAGFNVERILQFRIEVTLGDQFYYSNILVSKNDLEEARLKIYQFTLDKMVEQIDYYIDVSLNPAKDDL